MEVTGAGAAADPEDGRQEEGVRRAVGLRWRPDAAPARRAGWKLQGRPLWRAPSGQGFSPGGTRANTTDVLQGCARFTGGIRDRERD